MRANEHRNYFVPAMGLLIAVAWVVLWTWEQSPYSRYLHHGQFGQLNLESAICRAFEAGVLRDAVVPAILFVVGWTLMIVAMMLPSSLPLMEVFRRLTRQRHDRHALMVLLILGYLGVWGLFGIAAHLLDWMIYQGVEGSVWLQTNAWIFGASVLLLAGLFQFSSLKYRCLEKCRSPISFVMGHWRWKNERLHSFLLGAHHGIFCVGCCWALMLLMFVIGTGSLGWMLVLGAIMALEKNSSWGQHLSTPLGLMLIIGSGALVVTQIGFLSA